MGLNLKNIIKGFTFKQLAKFNLLSKETQELSKDRVEICGDCSFLKTDVKEGKVSGRCGLCGCWIPEKTFVKEENCPINKW